MFLKKLNTYVSDKTLYLFPFWCMQIVLIRLISSHKPIIGTTKLSSRTVILIKNISVSSAPAIHYAAALKGLSTALESILRRLFRDSSQVHSQLHVIFEGIYV